MNKKWLLVYSFAVMNPGYSDLFDYSADRDPSRDNPGIGQKENPQRSWLDRFLQEDPKAPPRSHGHAH